MIDSFIEFLIEDAGDLELQRMHNDKEFDKKDYSTAADQFRKDMEDSEEKSKDSDYTFQADEPKKGDILTSGNKIFMFVSKSPKGFEMQELGSDSKNKIISHGYKFKKDGKTDLGKTKYRAVKK